MMSWEDFKVGERQEMGRHTFTEDEIVAFARQFDPQPFHTDEHVRPPFMSAPARLRLPKFGKAPR